MVRMTGTVKEPVPSRKAEGIIQTTREKKAGLKEQSPW